MLGKGYVHYLHPVREERYGNLFIKKTLLNLFIIQQMKRVWSVPDIALISSKDGVARIAMEK